MQAIPAALRIHVHTDLETFITVVIRGLKFTGGDVADNGGAILNREHLTIQNSTITGNAAQGDDGGGGVHNRYGSLALIDCLIQNNSSTGSGGAILNRSVPLQITNSTLVGNTGFNGGAIFSTNGNVSITASTIADKHAAVSGGGIRIQGQQLTLTSSTLSGNTADADGGAIFFSNGRATMTNLTVSGNSAVRNGGGMRLRTCAGNVVSITHTTITSNRANTDSSGADTGGGIFVAASSVTLPQLDHTIVAGNLRNVSTRDAVFGAIAARFSLIGDNTAAMLTNNGGNMIGTSGAPVNPQLDLLGDYGGRTFTHRLRPGNPAIDAGDPTAVAGAGTVPLYDQRGAGPFYRVFDRDGSSGERIDIGAYELAVLPLLLGDYNQNEAVDATDYVLWRNTLGMIVTRFSGADGNGDGMIDQADHGVWRAHFGQLYFPDVGSGTLDALSAESQERGRESLSNRNIAAGQVDETIVLTPSRPLPTLADSDTTTTQADGFAVHDTQALWHDSSTWSRGKSNQYQLDRTDGNDLLLLLAIDRVWRFSRQNSFVNEDIGTHEHHADDGDRVNEIDEPLAVALSVRRGERSTYIVSG